MSRVARGRCRRDVLDTLVQLREWKDLPPGKRGAGVGSAAGAAVVGGILLAVNR